MNIQQARDHIPDDARPSASEPSRGRRAAPWLVAVGFTALGLVVGFALFALLDGDSTEGQTTDIEAQGGGEPMLATDGARLIARADGLSAEIEFPVPEPGTYEYPTADMIPPTAEPHPPVSPGASDAPEVFTAWLFAFNHPDRCTDARCDVDDIGLDAPARGGVHQLDGRIAESETLTFAGTVRLGQVAANGAPLENPLGAEIHVAVAPHGRALSGADGQRQLNGPIGNPTLWWAGTFPLADG